MIDNKEVHRHLDRIATNRPNQAGIKQRLGKKDSGELSWGRYNYSPGFHVNIGENGYHYRTRTITKIVSPLPCNYQIEVILLINPIDRLQ